VKIGDTPKETREQQDEENLPRRYSIKTISMPRQHIHKNKIDGPKIRKSNIT